MFCVTLTLNRQTGTEFVAGLPDDDPQTVVWLPETGDKVTVESFCDSEVIAEALCEHWRQSVSALGQPDAIIAVTPVREADWATDWRSHFQREQVSENLVICPEWEPYEARPGEWVVRIDPGMSFGTGQHATTRACLKFLTRCRLERGAGLRFLDLGCGSGILSVAAALMGFGEVTAIDNDPRALPDTVDNSRRNGVESRVQCRVADLAEFPAGKTFDVVAANLLADVLIEHADGIAACVDRRTPGELLVAGILRQQYAAVLSAYQARGFDEVEAIDDGDWRSGRLRCRESVHGSRFTAHS